MRGLLRILLVFLGIMAVLSIVRGMLGSTTPAPRRAQRDGRPREPEPGRLVRDPVCGTYVAAESAVRAGDHFFCSDDCRSKYLAS